MDIKVPAPLPFSSERRKSKDNQASFGQTGNAQWSATLGPIRNELSAFTRETEEFDPDGVDRVEQYLENNAMSPDDARYLRRNGSLNQNAFALTLQTIKKKNADRDIMARSSADALMITDPNNIFMLLFPASAAIAGKFARTLSTGSAYGRLAFRESLKDAAQFPATSATPRAMDLSGNRVNALRQIVRSKQTVSSKPLNKKQIAKIGALDAALSDGTINITQALAELDISDTPDEILGNAALLTGASALIGGAVGYGLGAAMGPPLNRAGRTAQVRENYAKYLDHLSKNPVDNDGDLSYSGKFFTQSPFMKAVPSPVRTEINDPLIPEAQKSEILQLAGDNAILFEANRVGKSVGNSVHIEAGRRDADWFQAVEVIDEAYRAVSPRGLSQPLGMPITSVVEGVRKKLGKSSFSPQDWYEHIGKVYVDQVPYDKMTPHEASSVQALESFFQKYQKDLSEVGLLNTRDLLAEGSDKALNRAGDITSVTKSIVNSNKDWMNKSIKKLEAQNAKQEKILDDLNKKFVSRGLSKKQLELKKKIENEMENRPFEISVLQEKVELIDKARDIDDLFRIYNSLDMTSGQKRGMKNLQTSFDAVRKTVDGYKKALDARGEVGPSGKKRHFPRFWNRPYIDANRAELTAILSKYYKANPTRFEINKAGNVDEITLPIDEDSIRQRVKSTIDNILDLSDEDMVDAMFTGYGRSSPLMSRRLDIPSELVSDFIIKDVKSVLIAYTSRVAPKIEFHRRVTKPDGSISTLEDHLTLTRKSMAAAGVPKKNINRYTKNYVALYDQIVGTNRKRPDAIDTKFADALQSATSLTFLGGAGLAALGDTAALFMDHELKTIGRALTGMMDDLTIGMGKRELNLAGEALELSKNMAQVRYQESLSNDMFNNGITNKVTNAFYMLNGLGPVTVAVKSMDSLLRGHSIIEYSEKFLAGTATKFEKEFLARYNITPADMETFARMPTEKSSGGLILANTDAWTDEAATEVFRNALRSGVMNRVIMGTPADKPIIMGGVAYVPDSVADLMPFDLPKDPRVPGYRRVESGLLALPFTFYSYTLGALSKITANYATGSVRNKAVHTAVALGLGAAIVKVRTPSWAWDEMDTEDKLMRAFDFSGLAAIYTDLMYRSLSLVSDVGIEANFPIQPRFVSEPDKLGAAVSLGGAPADYAYNILSGLGSMASGNYGEGAKDLIKNMPVISAMAFGGVIEDSAIGIASYLPNRP
jgi:uncharacterized coiled-coil protein SlyX